MIFPIYEHDYSKNCSCLISYIFQNAFKFYEYRLDPQFSFLSVCNRTLNECDFAQRLNACSNIVPNRFTLSNPILFYYSEIIDFFIILLMGSI